MSNPTKDINELSERLKIAEETIAFIMNHFKLKMPMKECYDPIVSQVLDQMKHKKS